MRPTEMTTQHDLMPCPVCGQTIAAEVTVQPNLGKPEIGDGNTVTLPVTAEMTRFNVKHNCHGRVMAEEALS